MGTHKGLAEALPEGSLGFEPRTVPRSDPPGPELRQGSHRPGQTIFRSGAQMKTAQHPIQGRSREELHPPALGF